MRSDKYSCLRSATPDNQAKSQDKESSSWKQSSVSFPSAHSNPRYKNKNVKKHTLPQTWCLVVEIMSETYFCNFFGTFRFLFPFYPPSTVWSIRKGFTRRSSVTEGAVIGFKNINNKIIIIWVYWDITGRLNREKLGIMSSLPFWYFLIAGLGNVCQFVEISIKEDLHNQKAQVSTSSPLRLMLYNL